MIASLIRERQISLTHERQYRPLDRSLHLRAWNHRGARNRIGSRKESGRLYA